MKNTTSINDVARLAQVSKATVSRVISGSRGVKEESRQAVLRAVEILNYQPNFIGQSLASQSTGCIGVICATEHIQQATGYLQALEKQLSQHQKYLLLRFADNAQAVDQAIAELSRGLCDAVMVVGARFDLPSLPDEVVLIDCLGAASKSKIDFDYLFATETAGHYLISHNRKKIALLNFHTGEAADQVMQGYRNALESYPLPYNRQLVIDYDVSVNIALQGLITANVQFDALLVTDYYIGLEAVKILRQFQRSVPEQVIVFSLDGCAVQMSGEPHLPAINYPLDVLAQRALQMVSLPFSEDLQFPPLRGSLITPY
ncbi:LacI family DNA-binding transcriptional regulator [Pectobacteriaceae bacterium CE90]|nr:LacI family DNA-binding transcriptional regulator [Prodigiosinella sp. LS101]WJV56180.1 LacI family DNA-binding transcriptional regulator [Prodigiosinella sp. LS101]WJV60544.1 LacI family DNA-binding transcriptional regulator [Pectobacteriaceae bacterium C111]WJY17348.1 LacI family DNA-binding transcriptional regulator [Pectobacteriaceae bacterium CE90]